MRRKEACIDWHQAAVGRPQVGEGSFMDDIENEAQWIQSTLTRILDKHVTQIRVTT